MSNSLFGGHVLFRVYFMDILVTIPLAAIFFDFFDSLIAKISLSKRRPVTSNVSQITILVLKLVVHIRCFIMLKRFMNFNALTSIKC